MGNNIFLLTIVVVASALFANTFYFPTSFIAATSSPESFPRAVLLAIIVTGILLCIRDWKKHRPSHVGELFRGMRLYVVLALPAYLLILPWLGFTLSGFLLLFLLFSLLRESRPDIKAMIVNAFLSAGLSFGVFLLFNGIFHIQLPTGWFDI